MIFKESQCLQENRLWFSDEHSAMYFIQRMLIPDCLKQVIKTLKIKESDWFFFLHYMTNHKQPYSIWNFNISLSTYFTCAEFAKTPVFLSEFLKRHATVSDLWLTGHEHKHHKPGPGPAEYRFTASGKLQSLAVIMGVKLITSYYRLTCYTQINCTTQKPGPLNQCWALVAHHICSWPLQSLETLISHIHCGGEESGPLSPDALPVQQTRHQKALHTSVHLNSTVSL